jgi:hypothetical protein
MGDVLDLCGGAAMAPLSDLVACVDRELKMRRQVYPRWVAQGKLTEALAARELAMMGAVRARLVRAEAEHTVLSGLGVKHSIAHRHLQEMIEEAEKLVASQVGPAS